MEQKTHKLALPVVFGLALAVRIELVFAPNRRDCTVDAGDLIANDLIEGTGFSCNGTDRAAGRGSAYPLYMILFFCVPSPGPRAGAAMEFAHAAVANRLLGGGDIS